MDSLPEPRIVSSGSATVAPAGGMIEALIGHFSSGTAAAAAEFGPGMLRELREALAGGEHVGADMHQLWIMLETVLARAGMAPGDGSEQDCLTLLNLACGHCEEAAVLSAFFGRAGRPVRQFAVDLRDREIDKARRRYAATEAIFREAGVPAIRSRENTIEFLSDDATRLAGYGQVPGTFDIIFIRHQNLWNSSTIWRRIYAFALDRITASAGALIITSYFDREHLQALELLRALGGTILVSERNPRSRALDYPGKSVDRHVAVIRAGNAIR